MPRFGSTPRVETLLWPASRAAEAIEIVARKSGFLSRPVEIPPPPTHLARSEAGVFEPWLETTAIRLGLEVEPVVSTYADMDQLVRSAGPALLRMPGTTETGEPHFLVLLKGSRRHLTVITPSLSSRRIRLSLVTRTLGRHIEAPFLEIIARVLKDAGIPEHRHARTRAVLLRQWFGTTPIEGCWLIRLPPGTHMAGQIRHARIPTFAFLFTVAYVVQQLLDVVAWWVIGRSALQGYFEWAWLWAWLLILATRIPFQLLGTWSQNAFATMAGALFKMRLMYGTLQLEPEETRHQGAGQFLGRVMESEAVEMLTLDGGFRAVIGLIGLVTATVVLALGAGGAVHALLFVGWVILTVVLGWQYYRNSRDWVASYREMTNDLVERMVGHRTRLAQEDRAHWHDEEDRILSHYLKLSTRLDRVGLTIRAAIVRGWFIVGLAGFVSSFAFMPASPEKLAISLGGIILAYQALESLVGGVQSVVNLLIAWQQIAPLYHAAARPRDQRSVDGSLLSSLNQHEPDRGQPLLIARDLVFRYQNRAQPVLHGCSLQIQQGDRILLEGPSGGGKSTLAAILTGLRLPESGLLLLRGFDRQTLGSAEWRRRVVAAPQFHENHVLTETFAFNLLMGRQWPPSPEDLAEAEAVCRELGLGELLDRMPAGLFQMVGESGWQLSHGERSRLYIARALLQKADFMVLDESFAALDPENLQRALQCVLNRAPTLLVIAHP
ncbi:MAG: ABC transporter ATP-binding protein [Chloroflexaceae bacterium]|nr:ABC transporter ATP-binding protein [Chloroflexaceae bacterium]